MLGHICGGRPFFTGILIRGSLFDYKEFDYKEFDYKKRSGFLWKSGLYIKMQDVR